MNLSPKAKKLKNKLNAFVLLIVWFALAWSWTLMTDSVKLSGSSSQGHIVGSIVAVINAGLSGYIIWLAFRIVNYVFNKYRKVPALLISLAIFAAADFAVAWAIAIIWLGPQGSIDNVLPLGSPTLLLIRTPFAYASRITGFYGLAAFAWLGLFLLARKNTRKLILYPAVLLSLLSIIGWAVYKNPSGGFINAKVVNERLNSRVPPVAADGADFILFPEYGLDDITPENISERIDTTSGNSVKYIGSKQYPVRGKAGQLNTLIFGDTRSGVISQQGKHRLIPGGEDMAYIGRFSLVLTRQTSTLYYFDFAKQIYKSPKSLEPIMLNDTTRLGAAVCSSIVSPEDYRRLALSGASIFTNSASLGIFNGSAVFDFQQKSLARFMATANSRYFIQSANDASSYALDTNGRTIASTADREVLTITARNNLKKTAYTFLGEWLAVSGGVLIAFFIIRARFFGSARHKNKRRGAARAPR